jgi:hypothetical protein
VQNPSKSVIDAGEVRFGLATYTYTRYTVQASVTDKTAGPTYDSRPVNHPVSATGVIHLGSKPILP